MLAKLWTLWTAAWKDDESGQGLSEYALIIALVAIVLIVALELFTSAISGVFTSISTTLSGAAP